MAMRQRLVLGSMVLGTFVFAALGVTCGWVVVEYLRRTYTSGVSLTGFCWGLATLGAGIVFASGSAFGMMLIYGATSKGAAERGQACFQKMSSVLLIAGAALAAVGLSGLSLPDKSVTTPNGGTTFVCRVPRELLNQPGPVPLIDSASENVVPGDECWIDIEGGAFSEDTLLWPAMQDVGSGHVEFGGGGKFVKLPAQGTTPQTGRGVVEEKVAGDRKVGIFFPGGTDELGPFLVTTSSNWSAVDEVTYVSPLPMRRGRQGVCYRLAIRFSKDFTGQIGQWQVFLLHR